MSPPTRDPEAPDEATPEDAGSTAPNEAPSPIAQEVGSPRAARAVGAVAIVAAGALIWFARPRAEPPPAEPAEITLPLPEAGLSELRLALPDAELVIDAGDAEPDPLYAYSGWRTWEDGGLVPPLPQTAPHAVRFGAALFPYAGAEFAPSDAPSRADAKAAAEKAIEQAATDFARVVAEAPSGSPDLGLMHRGILEPPVEYSLFTLKVGDVSPHPVDTPRGYWVMKRLR
ncbi:MAG: peptidyl-prolyl cis-trans isomerase [Polyangiaceae bacterium]|nr:peptidyl-prolyl cis-trans isomerase [Polyangiaceae bacterium]MCW5790701.1 peptidyl-prolyl cis-trans isomerase [Polyangiaceae bacterium]